MENIFSAGPEVIPGLPSVVHESYYRQLVHELPVAIYTCNLQGVILFYNKAASKIWGRSPKLGSDVWCGSWKIYDPEGRPVLLDDCPMALTLKEGKPIRGVEIIVERPDGSRVNVLPHPDPIYDIDGKLIGAVNMLVDITEHKQTKEANILLGHYNSQLEQFAYAASHDMQEPLRKIHTFSSMLLENNASQLDEKGKTYLIKISESAGRMNSLIQDLLDFSRETRTDDLFTETDLNKIIENIQTDLELLIVSKGAKIKMESLPLVKAIPSQMNRLFYNLVQNALKFSRPDTTPVISISATDQLVADNHGNFFLQIDITDNGIGFDQKHVDKIFQLFQRLNDRQSYSGNGIGLALCKKIVENHHGTISAYAEPNKGTTFSIKLPVGLLVGNQL